MKKCTKYLLSIQFIELLSEYTVYNLYGTTVKPRIPGRGSSKRGRPRGSRRASALGRFNTNISTTSQLSSGKYFNNFQKGYLKISIRFFTMVLYFFLICTWRMF